MMGRRAGHSDIADKWLRLFVLASAASLGGCVAQPILPPDVAGVTQSNPNAGEFAEKLARLENAGISGMTGKGCFPSNWFEENSPAEVGWGSGDSGRRLIEDIAKDEGGGCKRTRHLIDEEYTRGKSSRTYRCKFRGRDLEMAFAVERDDRKDEIYTRCAFALSVSEPFSESKRYTRVEVD